MVEGQVFIFVFGVFGLGGERLGEAITRLAIVHIEVVIAAEEGACRIGSAVGACRYALPKMQINTSRCALLLACR